VSGNTLQAQNRKSLILLSGRAYPELAERIAAELGVTLMATSAYDFANGEIYVRYEDSVRGSDAFVIQSHTAPINTWVMETLIMIDALKRASAKRITVVTPFYPYSRQDKKHRGREPISARLISDLFERAGADRIMSVDLHTAQIQGFFDGPVDHLFALPLLADYVQEKYATAKFTVEKTLPVVTFGKHPKKVVKTRKNSVKLRFGLKSSVANSTFICRIDNKGKFKPCKARFSAVFKVGRHVVAAKAVDPAGTAGEAATFKFRVEKVAAKHKRKHHGGHRHGR